MLFRRAVEAVRTGYVVARDQKAARQWDNRWRRQGLTGAALDAQMRELAARFPDNVKLN